jgi:RNA polymerase sigma-70 factor (ECF subfamily)
MTTVEQPLGYEIEQVKAGNMLAFEALYSKYKCTVYALCLRGTKDPADAEDLTQEVFLQVHRRVSSLRNVSAFKSWLFRVTMNIVLMHSRRRKIFPISIHYIKDPETSTLVDIVEALRSPAFEPIERIALARAISDLPKRRRAVLVLHDIKGMTHREIADSLGVSLSTTKSNLSRAHHQLRGMLRNKSSVTTSPATCGGVPSKDNNKALGETDCDQMHIANKMGTYQTQAAA